MKRRATILASMLIALILILTACNSTYDVNPVLYTNVNHALRTDFLVTHQTKDMYHDETQRPKSYTFWIQTQAEYDQIFRSNPVTIDFETEMIVLYLFTSFVMGRSYHLGRTLISDNVLLLQIDYSDPAFSIDTGEAYQKCMMFKMRKIDVTSVTVSVG